MEPLSKITISSNGNYREVKSLQQVVDCFLTILKQHDTISALYCFGKRITQSSKQSFIFNSYKRKDIYEFDLLLITKELPINATANLMDLVKKETHEEIVINLICHTPKQIATSSNIHRHFFASAIQLGWLVYGKPYELALLKLTNLPELDIKAITSYTQTRLKIAAYFLSSAAPVFKEPLLAAYYLHTSIEQYCLGLLYAFIGYHPNHFHIRYMLALCNHFTKIPRETFLQNTANGKELLSLLSTSYHDLRFKSLERYREANIETLYNTSLEFKTKIIPVIQEQLKNLAIQKNN